MGERERKREREEEKEEYPRKSSTSKNYKLFGYQAVLLCNTHWMSVNEQEEVFFCPFHLLEQLLPGRLKKMHSKSIGTGRSNRAIRLQSPGTTNQSIQLEFA